MFKRILRMMLTLCVICTVLSFTSYAASDNGNCGDGVYWSLDSKGTLTVSGTGKMTSAPWRTEYRNVIKKVIIEEGVTSIYGAAFDSCQSLTKVVIADSVTEIGGDAFEYCTQLSDVELPENLVTLGGWAFNQCAMTTLTIPQSLKTIGTTCFSGCPIENLYITDLTHFLSLDQASAGLKFKNLYIQGQQTRNLVIPNTVTSIPAYAFDNFTSLESVTIPAGVTSIGQSAFYGCTNLKTVNLPDTVTAIQSTVFGKCPALESLTLPVGVQVINSRAFYCSEYNYTSGMKTLRILGDAPQFASDAFLGLKATVYYSANNASWTEDVFRDYGGEIAWVADATIPGTDTGSAAVIVDSGTCGTEVYWTLDSKGTITISGTGKMTSSPWRKDYISVIKKVIIEEGVTSIYGAAFDSCESLTQVLIADTVTEIGGDAFEYCTKLSNVELPKNLVTLGGWAFNQCAMTTLTIPQSLETIGTTCFSGCPIENLYITDLTHFLSLDQANAGLKFKNLYVNGLLVQNLIIPDTVTAIPAYAFDNVSSLEKVTVPSSVTSIGASAFYGCENLKEVNLPGTVTAIQSRVFGKCPALESLTLPVGVLVINSEAFCCSEYNYNGSLKELRILGNAPLIAADAFRGFEGTVYYSANNASWTNDMFQNYEGKITWVADSSIPGTDAGSEAVVVDSGECGNGVFWAIDSKGTITISGTGKMTSSPWRKDYTNVIKQVIIENGVTNIYGTAFDSCKSLTKAVIADTVTEIGGDAFEYCTKLSDVTLPKNLVTLGGWAFNQCAMTTVTIPKSLQSMGTTCFSGCPIEKLYIEDLTHFLSLDQASAGLKFANLYLKGSLVRNLVIPTTVTSIPGYAFDNVSSLRKVTIPDSVTSIGTYAFYGCENLKEVILPDTVTTIQSHVFGKCTALESLTLPYGVQVIDSEAFYCSEYNYTSKLKELRILGNAPLIASDAFRGITATVYYSANNTSWSEEVLQNYGGEITWVADPTISGTGTEVGVYIIASGSCGENVYWSLNSKGELLVYGSAQARSVSPYAMDNYDSPESTPWYPYRNEIRQVTVASSVNSVGENAFSECENLKEVTIESGVSQVGANAFSNCEKLLEITFEGSAPEFGENCFSNVDADIFYPEEEAGWNAETLEGTGGNINLVPVEEEIILPFEDVNENEYYYDSVKWAVKHSITSGVDSTHFAPDMICNRAQVVTFLWRVNGSPEPASLNNPFDDVATDAYYYKAVLWAVENGITAGYGSDNIFNPDGACNRGQVATFLWRASGKPAVSDRNHPFVDIAEGEFYYDAVLWAVENGITNGYGGNTTFAPDVSCSRGQIVTFLYRAMK